MRPLRTIILHCSATEAGEDYSMLDIDRWHRHQGWNCIGYHYVIPLSGNTQRGRILESPGAHCLHHNDDSIGICYVGGLKNGLPADTRTMAQRVEMEMLVKRLIRQYPDIQVCGHHDFDCHKACPCFDVAQWAESVGIPAKNIYRP